MSADSCQGCSRLWSMLGAVLLAPLAVLYVLFFLIRGLIYRRWPRHSAGDDPDQGSARPALAVLGIVLILALVWRR